MKLTSKQKENMAKILINIGSITFAGLGIGFFSSALITFAEFVSGSIFTLFCFYSAIKIDKEDK